MQDLPLQKDFTKYHTLKQNLSDLVGQKDYRKVYRYLWDEYFSTLSGFAESYIKSKETAEEIVSDVLFQVWSKKEDLETIQHLKVYLFTAVRHKCFRHLSKQKKQEEVLLYTDEPAENLSQDTAADPETQLLSAELKKIIASVVDNLPPRCKLIYQLIREQGHRNKDVAVRLKISVNTIDAQLAIAIKKISSAIALYGLEK
ncbi:RNA polymerase sigma-70 factor [Desertivirga xinjiangensis]|uniref:RNA polymerase sigma-70 factor n=1 Tax=Desertivirga xinjiangensis TaxID=539206 RepID=UPI00210E04A4|nr:RNA polymerase sigma-70 factor [Pedobacter xinjiangensis]